MICASDPKPYRDNTSRKAQQWQGLKELLCFEPGFSLFHVHGEKKQHFLRWKHLVQSWSGLDLGSKTGEKRD